MSNVVMTNEVRDRLKNTLKPMKWNIFHFSLDPLPPSQKWNSVLLLASFYDGKHKHEANFILKKWNSDHEIAYPLPPPLVKNISLHWFQGIFETVPNVPVHTQVKTQPLAKPQK